MTNNISNTKRADLAQALIHLDKKRDRISLRNCPELELIDRQAAQIITMILKDKDQ